MSTTVNIPQFVVGHRVERRWVDRPRQLEPAERRPRRALVLRRVGVARNLLVDSSTLIWMSAVPAMLSARARDALDAAENTIFVSAASAWEIATKHRLGRLDHAGPLLDSWTTGFVDAGYMPLAINERHALRAGSYEVEHGDPFDRIIAAQAELERLVLVASDRAFDLFPVRRLW